MYTLYGIHLIRLVLDLLSCTATDQTSLPHELLLWKLLIRLPRLRKQWVEARMEQSNVYQYALSWHVINSAPRVSAVWYSGAPVEPEIQNDPFIRKILCMQ